MALHIKKSQSAASVRRRRS